MGANKEPYVVLNFFHKEFFRTGLMEDHLKRIAKEQRSTIFCSVDAEKSTFLVQKLKVQMLPSTFVFMEGRLVDWIIGFDSLGGTDQFKTPVVWKRLEKSGVIEDRLGNRRKKAARTTTLL